MSQSPRESFFVTLFNTRNRLRFLMDDAFRPLGITDATWRTLFYLEQTGSGVSQKQLADVMGIEGPSLVRLLDSLQSHDLIERRPSETDRRAKSLHLTKSAQKLLVELHEIATQVRTELLEHIDDKELTICLDVLNRILLAADNQQSS